MIVIPELPEVENVKISLENKLINKKIMNCYITENKLIKLPSTPTQFINDIIGLTIKKISRRGKYLIFTTDLRFDIIVHLGMTGLLIHVNDISEIPLKYSKHHHITLELNDDTLLCYCDIRKFGSLRLINSIVPYDVIAKMGPEPFEKDALKQFKVRLTAKKWETKTIKEAVLDQTVIAGIGNIYVSETLYASHIHPKRLVKSLTDVEIKILFQNIKSILMQSIKLGGTSVSDYLNGQGQKGQFQNYLKVYGKSKCECGNTLKVEKIKGRSTFYCLNCQK